MNKQSQIILALIILVAIAIFAYTSSIKENKPDYSIGTPSLELR